MRPPGHARAPAARSWLASLVLVVALTAYVGHAMIQLRRAVRPAGAAPSASAPPAPPGSDDRSK
ncbi:MAG: hypothetical protein ABJE95_35775 [Byssovorax sp.]